ncbi:hypothetical protein [Spirosoma lituiforme]
MNSNLSRMPFRQPSTTVACQQEQQHWQQIIRQQEEEIRQLRSLLLEVMRHDTCRSLCHDAVDYCRDLNQLQTKLDRLNRDLLCNGAVCSSSQRMLMCTDARFSLAATIERHATALVGEFSRINDGCRQFLACLMSLNLL